MFKKISLYTVLILSFSCKTISVDNEAQRVTSQNIIMGVIGEDKNFVLEQDYNQTAIPKYKKPIKVHVNFISFNKQSFKFFLKAKKSQSKLTNVNYLDSLDQKPQYLKLEIADRVTILNALNNKENRDVFQFLENKKEAHLVTSISMAIEESDIEAINSADEVFLEMVGKNSYGLKTYVNDKEHSIIMFNQGVVFAYQTSSFCWQENNRHQIEIVDIVETNDRCSKGTYRNAKRAKKEMNYLKF